MARPHPRPRTEATAASPRPGQPASCAATPFGGNPRFGPPTLCFLLSASAPLEGPEHRRRGRGATHPFRTRSSRYPVAPALPTSRESRRAPRLMTLTAAAPDPGRGPSECVPGVTFRLGGGPSVASERACTAKANIRRRKAPLRGTRGHAEADRGRTSNERTRTVAFPSQPTRAKAAGLRVRPRRAVPNVTTATTERGPPIRTFETSRLRPEGRAPSRPGGGGNAAVRIGRCWNASFAVARHRDRSRRDALRRVRGAAGIRSFVFRHAGRYQTRPRPRPSVALRRFSPHLRVPGTRDSNARPDATVEVPADRRRRPPRRGPS
ncbi:MAG: hypothetical protein KatS3mg076_1536 [Candidatus Binatia bacterium]|nr:MAG: hypothetical protein KatS3mg076_1536 [Candidatus Binatia bacterium]